MKRSFFLFLLCLSLLQWPTLPAAGSGEAIRSGTNPGAQTTSGIIATNWPGNSNEAWTWREIRAGKKADFNEKYGSVLDPVSSWHKDDREKRRLDPHFIQMVLTRKEFAKEIPNRGVRIAGAVFEKVLDLSSIRLQYRFSIEESRLEQGADFGGLKSSAGVSFRGSFFGRSLKMSWAEVKGNLILSNVGFGFWARERGLPFIRDDRPTPGKGFPRDVHLRGIKIDGSLVMNDGRFYSVDLQMAQIKGLLNMRDAKFKGPLYMALASEIYEIKMQRSTFEKVVFMPGVQVKSNLLMGNTAFREQLDLEGAGIGLNLSMVNAKFGAVDLRRAVVGGQLRIGKRNSKNFLKKSTFAGNLTMYGLLVTDQLYMEEAVFEEEVRMHGTHVKGSLSFKGSVFKHNLNLKGARIERDVYLDDATFAAGRADLIMAGIHIDGNLVLDNADFEGTTGSPKFDLSLAAIGFINYRGARSLPLLDLSGTKVEKVFVSRNESLWPKHIKLHGFEYNQFIFEQLKSKDRLVKYGDWLSRLSEYTPQPYMQAAKVMRENGNPEVADQILYAGKEKELEKAPSPYSLWLWILKITIGYGIYIRQFFYCAFLAWAIGTAVACRSELVGQIEKSKRDVKDSHNEDKLKDSTSGSVGGRGERDCSSENNKKPKEALFLASLFYSLDMLLPLIRLKFEHDRVNLTGWRGYYFYFHKMIGWFLATVLVSSLTGLINPIK